MDWQTLVITIVGSLASGGTIAAVVTARVSKKLGHEANEIEATKVDNSIWEGYSKEIREMFIHERDRFHSERQDLQRQLDSLSEQLEGTRVRISRMERREVKATRYIEKLKEHIWNRLPPPPPEPDQYYENGLD